MKSSRYLTIALLVLIVSLTFHKIYDPDFWWHLAAGDRMWTTHSILRVNTFSFTHPQYDWLDVYWLYQLALSWLWHWGGATAIIGFRLVLVLTLAALVLTGFRDRRQPLSASEAGILVLSWLLLAPRLTDRPELVSFVLLAGMLALIRQGWWWWCVALEIVWANMHGFFFWGPFLLASAAVSGWITGDRRAARTATLATVVTAAASLLSPFGWRNWLELPRLAASMRALASSVDELVSPFHPVVRARDGTCWLLIVFLALAVIMFGLNRRSVRPFDWIIMAASLPLALTVRRGIPLFVLCALPALLVATPRIGKPVACALVIGLCLALAIRLRIRGREFGLGMVENEFPSNAVEFVQQHIRGPLRLFNADFGTGGYLIAHGVPVFADERGEAYPTEFMREYFHAVEDDVAFGRMAQEYAVTHAFIVTSSAETRAFARRVASLPEWTTLYSDDIAVVLERRP